MFVLLVKARLVNTKLLGFCLLWDVTVYVIGCQNCPTNPDSCGKLNLCYGNRLLSHCSDMRQMKKGIEKAFD